jgi:beta propeller repeat protein
MRSGRALPLWWLVVLVTLVGAQAAAGDSRAYVHDRVLGEVAETGQARVMVTLWDNALPEAWAKDWRQRGPAIRALVGRALTAAPKFRVGREYEIFPFLAGTVDEAALEQLARCPVVEAVYPDLKVRAELSESGPLIGQPDAEDSLYTGSGVAIAIIDTGIDYTHADLGGAAFPNAKVIGGYDFVNSDSDPMDDHSHGTHVAGIAAGEGGTYRGIAPGARLIALKALDADGVGDSSDITAAVEWCITNQATHNIKVINLSLGDWAEWTDPAECDALVPYSTAMANAVSAGMVVVVASGNQSYQQGISFPACVSAATAVGATMDGSGGWTPSDGVASFSNRGELLDLFAPGALITSAHMGGGYVGGVGTSAATPHVAGAAACVISMGVTSPAAIVTRLQRSGVQIVDPVTDVGTPRIDLVGAKSPPTTGPDLVVTAVTSPGTSGYVGDSLDVSVTVRNQGDTASAACEAIVVLSANGVISPQDHVVATVSVPAVAGGANYSSGTVAAMIPGMLPGQYQLGGYADSGYVVTEQEETNNGLVGAAFEVIGMTSRVVSNSIPQFMLKGQMYGISVRMENDGTTSWRGIDGDGLAAVSPVGTARWGVSSVSLPLLTGVDPGLSYEFTFNVTAPPDPGWYPCHWQMSKDGKVFGEVATGATRTLVRNDATYGQDYAAVSGERVAYEDYSGIYRDYLLEAISVTNLTTMTTVTLPEDIPFPIDPGTGGPYPPYEYFDISYQWYPDISGTWVTWMVDDVPSNPSDPANSIWYWQVTAYNLASPWDLPRRITYQAADALYPSIDGNRVVWEDYRNDADGMPGGDFLSDNADIYIYDLATSNSYALCTASGPQFAPRVSGDLVVWEDWRDLTYGQIYLYDLSVDTDDDGTPNWKDPDRPSPDPAETQLTSTAWAKLYPDVSGRTVVWMDLQRSTGVDIYALDVDTMVETAVATDPMTYRDRPRIDDGKVVWTDYRGGLPDVYWSDVSTGVTVPIGGSASSEWWADISGRRVVYGRYRTTVTRDVVNPEPPPETIPKAWDVYNVWTERMLLNGSVGVHTFTDVTNSHWAWGYIEATVENGVVNGYEDHTYRPLVQVTRDQMAVFIARAMGLPTETYEGLFEDVKGPGDPEEQWAWPWIEALARAGIVRGYTPTEYRPRVIVKRDTMAVYVARALWGGVEVPTGPEVGTFDDVPDRDPGPAHWAYDEVEYCVANGVVSGYTPTEYRPDNPVDRGQMAVFVARAFGYTLP